MVLDSILKNKNENNVTIGGNLHQQLPSNKKIKWMALIFFLVLSVSFSLITSKWIYFKKSNSQYTRISQQDLLDGCRYVYIDLGTNIGIQIRKLYEPHLYPNAHVLPLFKQIFENHSNEVCSVGFEANPLHENYLKEFENYCLKHNWRVKIFTSTAVSIIEKNLTFYIEPGNEANNQWGASLEANIKKPSIIVPSIDIVSWFKKTVLNRKIPPGFASSKIMMKIDIEGHDPIVLANLILNGIYCSIDLIYGEHFDKKFQNAISVLQQYSNSCKTKLIYMDDESYHNKRFPFIIDN
ncbi:unnamed protein product [Rotaria sp. Silwood1]|nr:unnamed protein product [Rotaria sp. Silwood1]CAF1244027.1 unnamed protein product [Rotaria sp. Silwood1]CAF3468991.1 unnamed protein product [Rotaria sp. Silwood1]CAF3513351.1 unnamed protein product [Rotaria sp. Silwood1]CAF3515130.1 unnamed protein product [Rotaria sp. Silwood1]